MNAPSRRWFPDRLTDRAYMGEPFRTTFVRLAGEPGLGFQVSAIEEENIGDKDLTVIRFKFWDEFNKSCADGRTFNQEAVSRHVGGPYELCSRLTIRQWAYVLLEPLNYVDTYRDLYNTSILRMRQILSDSPIGDDGKIELSKARLQFNIFQMLDNRILGQNVNVNLSPGPSGGSLPYNGAIGAAITSAVKGQSEVPKSKELSLEHFTDDDEIIEVAPIPKYVPESEGAASVKDDFNLEELTEDNEVYRTRFGVTEFVCKYPEWVQLHKGGYNDMVATDIQEWAHNNGYNSGMLVYRVQVPPVIYPYNTEPPPYE